MHVCVLRKGVGVAHESWAATTDVEDLCGWRQAAVLELPDDLLLPLSVTASAHPDVKHLRREREGERREREREGG